MATIPRATLILLVALSMVTAAASVAWVATYVAAFSRTFQRGETTTSVVASRGRVTVVEFHAAAEDEFYRQRTVPIWPVLSACGVATGTLITVVVHRRRQQARHGFAPVMSQPIRVD